ncbi:hypothetical protein SAMN05216359_105253 [Roseateles sp. YR242]|uniref:hypothetical protein n=1 Tax=Roseateles sp. YR242 TaxID=1855305 RepID=UPI0008CD9C6E|nr:hypothetical protein [Roseateles sp. YR242]SEL11639.1 hypothetical protein SAMN05216359_105253 [Roseateles sp. YR242]
MSDRTCSDCKHYRPAPTDSATVAEYGECRAHPPTVIVIGDEPVSEFPAVNADEGCGEWEPKQ